MTISSLIFHGTGCTARSLEDETRIAHRNANRNDQASCLFSNEPFEKRPVMTIEDFVSHSDDHFESRLLRHGWYKHHLISIILSVCTYKLSLKSCLSVCVYYLMIGTCSKIDTIMLIDCMLTRCGIYMYTFSCIYTYINIYKYTCIYICVYICIYVCIHIHIYI